MTEAQNNMSQTIAQSVATALTAYGINPQAGHHILPQHIARAPVSAQIHPSPTTLIPPKLLP
ncbi:hypothetical protein SLEP1_g53266 [Rubroshorea leprosula]|uniref:Uncharacterized protein n=1 Tax=Rubroshorea leprosula TaxID=152421 RepID=A0AAV5MBQ4_9ROSI|nr:hypothetical protein SLEP1_g53266 [Rubroshorea leprosula]